MSLSTNWPEKKNGFFPTGQQMSGQTQKKEVIEATSESHMTRHGDEQTTNYWNNGKQNPAHKEQQYFTQYCTNTQHSTSKVMNNDFF